MKNWKLWLTGCFFFVLFMLVLTPAAWWLKLVPQPAALQYGRVQGTLWQGHISAVRYNQLYFSDVRWSLNGWALLTGKVKLRLDSGQLQNSTQPYLNADVVYGFNGLSLNNTLFRVPVAQLVPSLQLPMPVQASGELLLDIRHYRQGLPWCDALTGSANWQQARLQPPGSSWLELNTIYADLGCQQGELALTIDGDNPLQLAVTALLKEANRFSVSGTIKPDSSMPPEVHQTMRFLGQPDAEGRYRVNF